MELVEGEDLSVRLSRGALSPEAAISIARQIAGVLEAARERGIVHRDFKARLPQLGPPLVRQPAQRPTLRRVPAPRARHDLSGRQRRQLSVPRVCPTGKPVIGYTPRRP